MLGLEQDPYLLRLAQVESSLNPNARNPASSAKGLFQFIDSTGKDYGLDQYEFGTPEYTQAEIKAAQALKDNNARLLQQKLGREPTPGELYLAHQQGGTGAARLLKNPQARAIDIVGEDAVILNAGDPNMTAADFAGKWINKFEQQKTAAVTQGQTAAPDTIDVEMPDGTLIEGVPAGITKAELMARLKRNGIVLEQPAIEEQPITEPAIKEPQAPASSLMSIPEEGGGVSSALRRLGSGARTTAQGMTFGLGDEMQAALAALPVSALSQLTQNPMNPKEAYGKSLNIARGELKQIRGDYPIQSIATEIAGSLPAGAGSARALTKGVSMVSPQKAQALAQFAKLNPVKAGGAIAAGSGGVYGFNEAEGGFQNRAETGIKTGAIAAPFGMVGGAIAKKIGSRSAAAGARRPNQNLEASSEVLRTEAGKLYRKASEVGGRLKPEPTKRLLTKLAVSVEPKNRVEKALQGDNVIAKAMDDLGILTDGGASFDELHSLEKKLGELANDNVVAATGKLNATGNAFKDAQKLLRKAIDDIDPEDFEGGKEAFNIKKQADKLWGQSLKLNEIEKVKTRAMLQEQPSTGIRSGMRTILANPNRTRNYDPQEFKLMRQAAEMDIPTSALRAMGSRLLPTFAAGGTVATGFNPVGLALTGGAYVGSSLARKGANAMQQNKLNTLMDQIANPNSALRRLANPRIVYKAGATAGVGTAATIKTTEDEQE